MTTSKTVKTVRIKMKLDWFLTNEKGFIGGCYYNVTPEFAKEMFLAKRCSVLVKWIEDDNGVNINCKTYSSDKELVIGYLNDIII